METIVALALGVVVVAVAPTVPVLRDVSKTLVKGGLAVVDKSKEAFSSSSEHWSDLVAEARQEMGEAGTKAAEADTGEVEVTVAES
jgi:hypothetical protein